MLALIIDVPMKCALMNLIKWRDLSCALKSPNWSITKAAVQSKHVGLINFSGYRSKTYQSIKAI